MAASNPVEMRLSHVEGVVRHLVSSYRQAWLLWWKLRRWSLSTNIGNRGRCRSPVIRRNPR